MHFLNSSNLPLLCMIPDPKYNFFTRPSFSKRGIASFYTVLSNHYPYMQITSLAKWLIELNECCTPAMWQRAFRETYKASHCSNHGKAYQKTPSVVPNPLSDFKDEPWQFPQVMSKHRVTVWNTSTCYCFATILWCCSMFYWLKNRDLVCSHPFLPCSSLI